MTKKVAIIGTRGYPSYYGGFETAVRKLAPYLAEKDWDVTVYGRKGAAKTDDPTRDTRVKVVVTRGTDTKSISTLSYGLTASAHAARKKPDVAIVMNVANGYFLPFLKLARVKTLVNVDGIEWDREKWGRLAKAVFRGGARFTARFADQLVFDSHEIARRWKQEFKRDGVFIPYGGEFEAALPFDEDFERRSYALVVARFVPENTVPEFVEAAKAIAENAPVVIVGSSGYGGPIDEQVASLANENLNVYWLGHVSDDRRLHALWQNAGVYFHGHSVGGTNPTLVQAMALKAPVIARDTPYNREVLGDAGHFCEPHPTDISDAVLKLLSDPEEQERSANAGYERAKESYTWDIVCAAYDTVARELIDER